MDRRHFNVALLGAVAAPWAAPALARVGSAGKVVLYSAAQDTLTHYEVDVEAATLSRRTSLQMPSIIQYAWPHPTHRYLYLTTSDATPGAQTLTGTTHRLCAVRITADGTPTPHGAPAVLDARPINNSLDKTGRFALTCYNVPSEVTVHRIQPDGTVGTRIAQKTPVETGIFPHQIRATPSNRSVSLVTRGNSATPTRPEDPGAIKLFRFDEGQLSPLENIVVGGKGGYGYGPRHLDFHPTRPWVYVALERENLIHMHLLEGDRFAPEPSFVVPSTQGDPKQPGTLAGAIHVHPSGKTLYVSNRASHTVKVGDRKVFSGGENSITVYALDPQTGEPRLIQAVDPVGFHVRAFTLDPSGRLLVAATMVKMAVRDGDAIREVSAGLSVFRIADDGKLTFVRKYDVALGDEDQQLWVGMFALPG